MAGDLDPKCNNIVVVYLRTATNGSYFYCCEKEPRRRSRVLIRKVRSSTCVEIRIVRPPESPWFRSQDWSQNYSGGPPRYQHSVPLLKKKKKRKHEIYEASTESANFIQDLKPRHNTHHGSHPVRQSLRKTKHTGNENTK